MAALPSIMCGSEKAAFFSRSSVTEMPPIAISQCVEKSSIKVGQAVFTNCVSTPSALPSERAKSMSMPSKLPSPVWRLKGG